MIKYYTSRCFLLGVLLLACKQGFSQSANDALTSQIDSTYKFGKYDEVIRMASSQVSDVDLKQGVAMYNMLGKAYLGNHRNATASFNFETALRLNDGDYEQQVISLLGLVEISLEDRDFSKTANLLHRSGQILDKHPSGKMRPYYLFYKAAFSSLNGNEDKSNEYYEQAIRAFPTDNPDLLDLYVWYTDHLIETAQYGLAKKYLDKLLMLAKDKFSYHKPHLASVYLLHAYYLHCIQENIRSIEIFEKDLLPLLNSVKADWSAFQKAEYYRIAIYPILMLGDIDKGIDYTEKYIEEASQFHGPNYSRFSEVYINLSDLYYALGSIELANSYLDKAIELLLNQKNDLSIMNAYLKKATSLLNNHDTENALSYLQKTIDYPLKDVNVGAYYYISEALFQKGLILNAASKLSESMKCFEEAIALREKYYPGRDWLVLPVYMSIAEVLFRQGYPEQAGKLYQEKFSGLDLKYPVRDNSLVEYLNWYSFQLISKNKLDSALLYLNKILPLTEEEYLTILKSDEQYLLKNNLKQAAYQKARVFQEKYKESQQISDLISAMELLKTSIDIIADIQQVFKYQNDRILEHKENLVIFDLAINITYKVYELTRDRKYLDDLFEFNELTKSSQLLESLNRNLAIQQSQLPDSILTNIKNLKKQTSILNDKIYRLTYGKKMNRADSMLLQDYQFTLTENKADFQRIMNHLETSYPGYYQLNYGVQTEAIETVQARLATDELLLEYFVSADNVYLLAISHDTESVFKLNALSNEQIERLQKITMPEYFLEDELKAYQEFIAVSTELYDHLVAEALEAYPAVGKLYIIPDKSLNYLPFELLVQDQPENLGSIRYESLTYLLSDYAVSYGNSATLLFRNSHENTAQTSFKGRLLAVAPSYEALISNQEEMSKLGGFREGFSELTYNKEEAEIVKKYFNGTSLKGKEATAKMFIQRAQNFDMFHLAMHAFVDNENPLLSKLVFANDTAVEGDNFLHNFELYNMTLNSKLTVLSACNTGFGQLADGEGVMSLARAFTYSGSESVVMSHWKIDDQSSNLLMQRFYTYLSEGYTKSEALRQAKLYYLQDASPNKLHPFFWGAFTVLGDDKPLSAKRDWNYALAAILFLLLALAILWYFVRKRQKSS